MREIDMQPYFAQLENSSRTDFIKGIKKDYNPKYYFEYEGRIYKKMKFEWAYISNFYYHMVDVVKEK